MKLYNKTDLSKSAQRKIKNLEIDLNKKCRKIWEFTNTKDERYIFARFGKLKDSTISTIAYFDNRVHRFLTRS